MITLCWAVKGGSGTSVVAAALALSSQRPTLLVDLDGEQHAVLGCEAPSGPGVLDWIDSDAPSEHLADLVVDIDTDLDLLPQPSRRESRPTGLHAATDHRGRTRWKELAHWLSGRQNDRGEVGGGQVVIDAGTGAPPAALAAIASRRLLVTRACYLSLSRAARSGIRPTGAVLVDEPWRALRAADVARAVGAPVEATIGVDPAVARAVDAGLLSCRARRLFGRLEQMAAA